jgi:hypothetical protein
MDRATLEARKQLTENQFAAFGKQKVEIVEEMNRLQGEHRLLVDLLKSLTNEKEDVNVPEPGPTPEPTE